jgi:hypothetical protein
MDMSISCPYCGQAKKSSPEDYCGCHICGYKSAVVKADDGGELMIVDRRMPYLERRCNEISRRMPDVSVIVDRRIAQDQFSGPDRREARLPAYPAD